MDANVEAEAWEIIRKSFRGFDEIDRMRGEIDRFVKMAIGLCEPYCYNGSKFHKEVKFPTADKCYIWEVKIAKKRMRINYLYSPPNTDSAVILYSSSGVELPHDEVAQAYSTFPAFYAGMVESYSLNLRLRPFLVAAEAVEKK